MNILVKYKKIILYIFFGVCTTIVNVLSYWFFSHILKFETISSSVLAWALAVLFAYFSNRKYVFESKNFSFETRFREFLSFILCRLGTGFIDWILMFVFVDIYLFNDLFIKVIANLIVILINYVASKLFVFRKRGEK
ncbi:MAG: GtrA family protein [Lachnospiraceae bacterium]